MSVRILQVGCGRWGKNVLRDLLQLEAEVVVVARSPQSVTSAREGGATQIVADPIDAGPVDGAVVVTPAPSHADVVAALAPLDVPIFCEKPLVTDPADGQRLLDLCGDRLFVMHKWRWHPGVEAMAGVVSEGRLGEITGLRSDRLGWGPFHFRVDSVDTLSPHCLSIAIAVLGKLPPVQIAHGTPYPGLEGGWAEYTAVLGDGGGPSVTLCGSAVSAHRLRRVEVVGTHGSATLADPEAERLDVLVHDGDLDAPARQEPQRLEREWPLLRELRDFVDHCAGGPPPRATGAEGVAVAQAIADVRGALAA